MDSFSKVLKDHISRLDIKIQNLAIISGVDRSLIQKMIKGDRVPADKDIIERIILALMLTPMQAIELRNLYHIARIGEEVYQRHLMVKDFLESFGCCNSDSVDTIKTNYHHTLEHVPTNAVFYGTQEINHLVKTVIEMEADKDNPALRLIIQPDYNFLLEHLTIIGCNYSNLSIEHVFCLQESVTEKDENRYNLSSIKNITHLLTSGCSYNPYIYYDDVPSHINNTSIFPYIVITSQHVVTISYDYTHAVLYQDIHFHNLFTSIYHNIKLYTIPLIEKLPHPLETFYHFHNFHLVSTKEYYTEQSQFTMFSQPYFLFFANKRFVQKYMHEYSYKNSLIELMEQRAEHYLKQLKAGSEYTTYFSLEGVIDFWETGRIREIPDEYYNPLDKADRLYLLDILYETGVSYNFNPIIVKKEGLALSNHLNIIVNDLSSISLIYNHPKKKKMYFSLKEKSLTTSFLRFFEYLKHSEFIIPKNESLKILYKYINTFKRDLAKEIGTSKI